MVAPGRCSSPVRSTPVSKARDRSAYTLEEAPDPILNAISAAKVPDDLPEE
jgi:hypothetical protein